MDNNWLKYLIAAACCMVIAGGGFFAFQSVQSAKADAEAHEWISAKAACEALVDQAAKTGVVASSLHGCFMRKLISDASVNRILATNGLGPLKKAN